jgi:hypothetical protein
MRKADLLKNHEALDEAIGRYREFMARVIVAQRVIRTQQEKRDLAESVLLRLCANWERFVDEHIVDCVNCDHSKLPAFLGVTIPAHPTRNLCEAIIFGGGYRDFHSTAHLIDFTRKILPDNSNPFMEMSTGDRARIDEAFSMRNYLSHYSAKARRSLDTVYKKKYKLRRFVEPGSFLLARGGKRLWAYFESFEQASIDMQAWCD